MKKLLAALTVVLGLGLANAQQVATRTTTTSPPTKVMKTKADKKNAKAVKQTSKNSAVKMKKDGTPDKRYKSKQVLKKDGTPDKRFKANK